MDLTHSASAEKVGVVQSSKWTTLVALMRANVATVLVILAWIVLSSGVIIFNAWILDRFPLPITLTTFHLAFSTFATQLLAHTTPLLDGRKKVKMTARVYMRAVLPIGFCFSLSLILGNYTYLYLSMSFIQMLKAVTPVIVLLATWSLGLRDPPPNTKIFLTVLVIVIGVTISSISEIHFVLTGFITLALSIVFEAYRMALIQKLLGTDDYKMNALVSLYYYAPACSFINLFFACIIEGGRVQGGDIMRLGLFLFVSNALLVFALNASSVFVIERTNSLVLCLCSIPKAVALIVFSMAFWHTPVTPLQIVGFAVALLGTYRYTVMPKDDIGQEKLKNLNTAVSEMEEPMLSLNVHNNSDKV